MFSNLLHRSLFLLSKPTLLCGVLWFLHTSISNAQVVLNEVYIRPDGLSTTPPNGLIYQGSKEYIEIYNKGCFTVDLSGYFIAMKQSVSNVLTGGTFRIPSVPQAILGPGQHVVIGSAQPGAGLEGNIDIPITSGTYCSYSGNFVIPNVDGWVALYNGAGLALDCIYWSSAQANITSATYVNDFNPAGGICLPPGSPAVTLQTARQIFAATPAIVTYIPTSTPIIAYRQTDGSTTWQFASSYNASTLPWTVNNGVAGGNCNGGVGACVTATAVNPPTVVSPVSLCAGAQGIALSATASAGGTLNWYGTNAVGGSASANAPIPSTAESGNFTYYVSQTIGGCESARAAIQVQIVAAPSAGNDAALTICTTANSVSLFSLLGPNVTGGGNWTGPSALSNAQLGTFNPSVNAAGIYTYTVPGQGVCPSDNSQVTVSLSASDIVPQFNLPSAVCAGATDITLPGTSVNGITGSWNPSAFNNQTSGSYTFTPNAGQCSQPITLTIAVNPALQASATATPNTQCCTYTGPAIRINEVFPYPNISGDACSNSMFNTTNISCGSEWIELYNPSPCDPIDVSCYLIGSKTTASNYGVFRIPNGTIIPPLGFLTIGGGSSGANLIIPNFLSQGFTCGGSRWFLENTAGWIALYNGAGTPVNAVYWTFSPNQASQVTTAAEFTGGGPTCIPSNACTPAGVTSLQGISTMPVAIREYAGEVPGLGFSVARTTDGATTWIEVLPTKGICNAACVDPLPPSAACTGAVSSVVSGGTGNYTYAWNNGTSQSAAGNLCAGTYCLTVTDQITGCVASSCAEVVNDIGNIPPAFNPIGPLCINAPAPALSIVSLNGITGSWSPAVISTAAAGSTSYTFTPNPGQCASNAVLTVVVNANVTPVFSPVGPYCIGSAIPALPSTSTNGIIGFWSPGINNSETTNYTFTPAAGQCAATAQLTIAITGGITPIFGSFGPYCQNAPIVLPILPETSNNGISGSWNPASISTSIAGNIAYNFTPDEGQCGVPITLTILVNPEITPTFAAVGPYCLGSTVPPLETTSSNGITGSWSPAINNSATTTYTFLPNGNQCASEQSLTITINPNVTPEFSPVGPYCSQANIPPLLTTSNNGISGTWSPGLNNTSTTSYTFTPQPGQCATTQNLVVSITPSIPPVTDFDYPEICQDYGLLSPTLAPGFTAGGTFTSAPELGLAETTGVINTVTSTPGSYLVTYSVPATGCNPSGFSVTNVVVNGNPVTSPMTHD